MIEKMTNSIAERKEEMRKSLNDVNQKIEKIEEKFISDEIDSETYTTGLSRLRQQRQALSSALGESILEVSTQERFISYGLEISANLSQMWVLGDYDIRVALQKLIFPDGILYVRESGLYRPNRVNSVFSIINSLSGNYEDDHQRGGTLEVAYAN